LRRFEMSRSDGPQPKAEWRLTASVEYDELDHIWVAECLELPGCFSQGDTEREAIENLTDAIGGVLTVRMQEHLHNDPEWDRIAEKSSHKPGKIALCV
jgi:predicted RNase H-like HicB family nuclease